MATRNQEKVLAIVVKDIKKGRKVSVSRSMRESGAYSESYAEQPQKLTESKGWKELVNEHLGDNFNVLRLRKLFDQKRVEYFTFSKNLDDDAIRAAVEDAGLEVINISYTEQGKLAWYSTDDVMAVTKALDMLHKIKGVYLADRAIPPEQTINYNLFYNANFQQTLQNAESDMKKIIAGTTPDAQPTQENPEAK